METENNATITMDCAKKKHVYGIDYIRALSALLIVLYHYTTRYDESIGHLNKCIISFPWGCFAVRTFFLLAGFLCMIGKNTSPANYLYKRIVRLFPTYWCCIIVTSVVMFCLMPDRLLPIKDIMFNFTMFPNLFGAENVDGAYWTLQIEFLFYILVAALLFLRNKSSMMCVSIWMGIAMVVKIFNILEIRPFIIKLLGRILIPQYCGYFIIGIILRYIIERGGGIATSLLFVCCLLNTFLSDGFIVGVVWTLVWSFVIYIAGRGFFEPKTKTSKIHSVLYFLAEISYPLYLLHQFIGYAFIQKFEMMGVRSEFSIMLAIVISITMATVIHYTFEVPLSRELLKKRNFRT